MKTKILFVFIIIFGIIITACGIQGKVDSISSSENTTLESTKQLSYEDIKPAEAKARIDKGEDIILLDVRTQEEYNEKHIPHSILIPVDVIEQEAPSQLTDKNAIIFIYCRSGRRSAIAAEALVKLGYTKIYNLGGINDWTYETESGD